MNKNYKKGFTLVELIVVITILTILATIWFVSYSSYLIGVRDTNRISQLKAIGDALYMYSTNKSLPIPDDKIDIKSWDDIIAYQWYVWADVIETISYSSEWKDPKDYTYFSYYLTKDRKYFQLMAFLEEENNKILAYYSKINNTKTLVWKWILKKTQAEINYENRYPYTQWRKLWIITTDKNIPIQETWITEIKIDDVWTQGNYKSYLKTDEVIKWSWSILSNLADIAKVWWRWYSVDDNWELVYKDLDSDNVSNSEVDKESNDENNNSNSDNQEDSSDSWNIQNNSFISLWDTRNVTSGSSNSNQIKLPLESSWTYNFTVDRWDGKNDTITWYNQAEVTHTYTTQGEYEIKIDGIIKGFRFNNSWDKTKILDIINYGTLNLWNSWKYFYGAENLNITATDALDLTGTTSLAWMFWGATSFNGDISSWDTSNITNITSMFYNAKNFNQDISSWDTWNVTSMYGVFWGANSFNGDISSWNTSNVNTMYGMFHQAYDFNKDISSWNTSNVSNMEKMFMFSSDFNIDLSSWEISKVTSCDNFDSSAGKWEDSKKPNFTDCTK